jgi:hypothetical protein
MRPSRNYIAGCASPSTHPSWDDHPFVRADNTGSLSSSDGGLVRRRLGSGPLARLDTPNELRLELSCWPHQADANRGSGSAGRASPCQGEGRGFESRLPLHETDLRMEARFFVAVVSSNRHGNGDFQRTIATTAGRRRTDIAAKRRADPRSRHRHPDPTGLRGSLAPQQMRLRAIS